MSPNQDTLFMLRVLVLVHHILSWCAFLALIVELERCLCCVLCGVMSHVFLGANINVFTLFTSFRENTMRNLSWRFRSFMGRAFLWCCLARRGWMHFLVLPLCVASLDERNESKLFRVWILSITSGIISLMDFCWVI